MARRESIADARAQLDLEQRADAYRINRRSRLIAQGLRVVAAVAGLALMLIACLGLLARPEAQGLLDLRVAGVASVGVGLFVGALRANPPDLGPSVAESDPMEPDDEQAAIDGSGVAPLWLIRFIRFIRFMLH